jgi:hypothetical protein
MKISSLLREAPKGPALSLDNDLMQRAMLRFPGYDSQQALSLYIADKAVQQQKTDSAQNNLINTQQNAIKSIGQELQDYEEQAQETDREVERLKQLSGTLTTGSADRQEKAKISADELEKLQKDLQLLKSKPGMDPEKFKNLETQIKELVDNPAAEDKDVNKLQALIARVQEKQSIGDAQFNELDKKLKQTQGELEAKERRFVKSLARNTSQFDKNASALKKYADIVAGYQHTIDNFEKEMNNTTSEIKNDAEEARNILNVIKQIYNDTTADVDPNAIPALPELPNKTNEPATTAMNKTSAIEPKYKKPDSPPTPISPKGSKPHVDPDELARKALTKASDSSRKYRDRSGELENLARGGNFDDLAESTQLDEYPGDKAPPKVYKDWGDPEFNEWMRDHLHILINMFKSRFRNELSRKSPTYGDGQISYDIQDEAWFLKKIFDGNDPVLTKPKMDAYLELVKMTLFSQPVEISHQTELFKESLDKTYSRMLDNLIGLPYIKG